MKSLSVIALLVLTPVVLTATQRVMVLEDVTATWCTYCPGAARGAEELKFRAFDSVVVIAYHASTSDPFYTATAAARKSYYGITGYPSVVLDGSNTVVGGLHTGTMYPVYRNYFDYRKTVSSPLDIGLTVTYDTVSRNGTLTIVVRNTSGSAVSGQLHTALIESHIYYPWQGMDSLQDVERTMLPSASGEAVTIPAGDSVVRTRNFTINSGWVAKNCELVVFVQDNSSREMFQGAAIAVLPKPTLRFVGYQPVLPVPDTTVNLTVGLRNIGGAAATGATAVLATTDPYITVTSATATFGPIPVGADGYANEPFTIQVASGCPDPHLATMRLIITANDAGVDTVTFPLNIATNTGFLDNMEFGEHGWTHDGILDNWHLTTYRSVSPTHSWYCGNDGSHQYSNENDARLMTPYFTVGESTQLHFQQYYATEDGYDFCVLELNNGSLFWRTLALWSGNSGGWSQEEFNLADFRGQTVQLRFRFISDYNVTAEGWYIDDFWCSPLVGVAQGPAPLQLKVTVGRSLVRERASIGYQLPVGLAADILVYDEAGRLVRCLGQGLAGSGTVTWDLRDDHHKPVPTGSYIVCVATGAHSAQAKVVVVR